VGKYLEEEGIMSSLPLHTTIKWCGEEKNRTLIDMARMMLGEYNTSDRFWAEAVNTTYHAINRLYLHRLLKKTTYELPNR
jgi:proline dehydrogenase